MQSLAIIANPAARRNREGPLALRSLRKAAPAAVLFETRQEAELQRAAEELARHPPAVLAIAGGDGTVQHTLTALWRASPSRLPPIALLGGGAFDSLAPLGGRGAPRARLSRLAEALAAGTSLRESPRDLLEVEGQLGFRFGAGLAVRFLDACYRERRFGRWASARLLARAVCSSATLGPFSRELYQPLEARVSVDGEEWPPLPLFGLVCASTEEAGLGLRAFRRALEQPGAFQVLGLTAGPRAFAQEVLRLLAGGTARRDRLLESVGERVEVAAKSALRFFLDGELFEARGRVLSVGLGPRVRLVQP